MVLRRQCPAAQTDSTLGVLKMSTQHGAMMLCQPCSCTSSPKERRARDQKPTYNQRLSVRAEVPGRAWVLGSGVASVGDQ